jgi:hypothetical protein
MSPKVYAVLLSHKKQDMNYLHMATAYSLEDAVVAAKRKLQLDFRQDPNSFRVDLFTHEPLESLFVGVVDEDMPEVKDSVISELMQRIVRNKDLKLFEEKKLVFSQPEQSYLEEILGVKSNKKK